MQTLYLYIENRIWIYIDTIVLFDIFCKTHFVLMLDFHKLFLCLWILCQRNQSGNLWQIGNPLFSNMFGYPVGKQWVRMCKETSLCNTVCLIVEFLREHFIEITKFLFFKNFCMKSCYTINRVTCNDCHICHLYLSIIEDCHLADFLLISRIAVLDFKYKTTVDFFYDLIYTRK